MSIYMCGTGDGDTAHVRASLRSFAAAFGLDDLEDHRSAGHGGIVALEVAQSGTRGGYIPYTNRPLKWHTDGYYGATRESVRCFILHCVRNAPEGGENALLDPEIAYIRMRDEDPNLVAALMPASRHDYSRK